MTSVPGASRFTSTAALAVRTGSSLSQSANILSDATADLLEAGRRNTGIGLSGNSRALAKQFLNQAKAGFNAVFGMSTVKLSSSQIIQQEILALRAQIPESQIAPSLRGGSVDETV